MFARFQLHQTVHEVPEIVTRPIYPSGIITYFLYELDGFSLLGCETDIVPQENKTNHRPWRGSAIWALSVEARQQEASRAPSLHVWTVSESLQHVALTVTPSFFFYKLLQHFMKNVFGFPPHLHLHLTRRQTNTRLSNWHHLFHNVWLQP